MLGTSVPRPASEMNESLSYAPSRFSAFHIMTKPVGPICNLNCKYCFYLEKENLYPAKTAWTNWAMQHDVLESYIRQYIEAQSVPAISFAWQGGEPTLLGVSYFRRVVELQKNMRRASGLKTPSKRMGFCSTMSGESF